jgi:hypothetical protein
MSERSIEAFDTICEQVSDLLGSAQREPSERIFIRGCFNQVVAAVRKMKQKDALKHMLPAETDESTMSKEDVLNFFDAT